MLQIGDWERRRKEAPWAWPQANAAMQWPEANADRRQRHLERIVLSNRRRLPCKRPACITWEERQPVFKRPCRNVLICMERTAPVSLESRKRRYSSIDMPATPSFPTIKPIHQPKKAPCCSVYDPFDFTSDELNPACEWLRNSSSTGKCSVAVSSILRRILSSFPLGLRLKKLETMMWNKYKINLLKVSLEQGCKDSLEFLQGVPGIKLKFGHRRPFRCIVLLDPAGDKV